jgi:hypothetical protein
MARGFFLSLFFFPDHSATSQLPADAQFRLPPVLVATLCCRSISSPPVVGQNSRLLGA